MSHPNAKLPRARTRPSATGTLPLLGALTDDIPRHDSTVGPLAGAYTGKDQVLGLFGEMMEVHGGTPRLEVADIFANDGRGVLLTQ